MLVHDRYIYHVAVLGIDTDEDKRERTVPFIYQFSSSWRTN